MRPRILSLVPNWLSICVLSAMPVSALAQDTGQRYAILCGVEEYNHSSLKRLDFAEDDAQELGKVLRSGGYSVTLLCDSAGKSDLALRPTLANLNAALNSVLKGGITWRDTVIVGLMGHGVSFEDDSYFCPLDSQPFSDQKKTLLSLGALYKQLDRCGAGVKVLLVDACRNDPDPGRGRGIDADTAPMPPEGVAVLFSCSRGERAYEHPTLRHGVFTYYLLKGLNGEARDSEGEVTFDSLQAFVRKQTARAVPKLTNGRQQSPNQKADVSGSPAVLMPTKSIRPPNLSPPQNLPPPPDHNAYSRIDQSKKWKEKDEKDHVAEIVKNFHEEEKNRGLPVRLRLDGVSLEEIDKELSSYIKERDTWINEGYYYDSASKKKRPLTPLQIKDYRRHVNLLKETQIDVKKAQATLANVKPG
jgi:hypothetical protein